MKTTVTSTWIHSQAVKSSAKILYSLTNKKAGGHPNTERLNVYQIKKIMKYSLDSHAGVKTSNLIRLLTQ